MEGSALAQAPEAEDDEGHCTATFVAEADELHALVQRIRDTQGAPDPGAYARVTAIVRERLPRHSSPTHSHAHKPSSCAACCSMPCSPPLPAVDSLGHRFCARVLAARAWLSLTPPALCAPDTTQLTKYQEQPQLLDPHLERLVDGLTSVLRDSARQAASGGASRCDLGASQRVAKLLHVLATTRDHKACEPPCMWSCSAPSGGGDSLTRVWCCVCMATDGCALLPPRGQGPGARHRVAYRLRHLPRRGGRG
jgi:hypothetical protein